MTDYLVLTDFIPGTKAKAQEVNANFSAVKDAINAKAPAEGDSTKAFSVAAAIDATHAISKAQLDAVALEMTQRFNGTSARFCAKSGNVTAGVADLFSYSGMSVTVKVGGSYPSLVISNYKGEFTTLTSIDTINMTGKTNGVYNIFVKSTGEIYTLANTVYKQPKRPTMVDGDIWLNTSVEPMSAIKYSGNADVEFLDVPLGKITIASSAISSVETCPYNQNGYDVNASTFLKSTTVNGWTKFPNGLILQWGENYVPQNSYINVTLPITYPNVHLQCVASNHVDIHVDYTQTGGACCPAGTSQIGLLNIEDYTSWLIRWFSIGY